MRLATPVCGERGCLPFHVSDRYTLIEKGIAGIDKVTLHPGSAYLISRATFPGYFLKEQGVVDDCHNQIDLQLFREHLAPALKITHRFVGTEPLCSLTRHYNQRMKALLAAPGDAPPVEVVELARIEKTAGRYRLPWCANCTGSATGRRWRRWCRREPSLF